MEHRPISTDQENQIIDATLDEISQQLKAGETLILDVSGSNPYQTDIIYDTLVLKGFNVERFYRNGIHQIAIKKPEKHY